MNCRSFYAMALLSVVMFCGGNAFAAQLNVLTFESGEEDLITDTYGATETNVGLDGVVGGVGITEGQQAIVMKNISASPSAAFVTYQFSSGGVGEEGANYAGFNAAQQAMDNGADVFLNFDFGFDASGTTSAGFFQPGIALNSDGGFSSKWFGALLQGNIGPGASSFPTLNATAASQGVTMTFLDPYNLVGGDPRGVVRISIPVGSDGTKALNLDDGGDNVNDFFQIQFHKQGGWGGTIDVSFDNVGFTIIPEPATLALAGLGFVTFIGRRRR